MTLDIKTSGVEPRRQTFANVARRLGADKPGSRYDEATLDVQPTENFHYRPLWDPKHELFDRSRTKIGMADWYAFRDPRQFYYGTYTIARARMMEAQEKNFKFVAKRNLLSSVDPAWLDKVRAYLIPLRHYEWGANMNNCLMTDYGYGTAITQATMFAATDRLGIAQMISRVGLMMDGNSGDSLGTAKEEWLHDSMWQGLRHMVEDSFVVDDWFEVLVAQNVAMDSIIHPLVFQTFDAIGINYGGAPVSLLNEFAVDWYADSRRWVDALLKVVAAESDSNRDQISEWIRTWQGRAQDAFKPISEHVLGDGAAQAMDVRILELHARLAKIGIEF
ncbi:MAG TPA: phenol hydroxylase [Sneathiellales bacterium]|nr:phenol hydroxylase [Sneathiellales bacterium]